MNTDPDNWNSSVFMDSGPPLRGARNDGSVYQFVAGTLSAVRST
jgi:hypothetical protein